MIAVDEQSVQSLRPNLVVLLCGSSATAIVSFIYLPWAPAILSSVLGVLMIAGADVDARTFLLPDVITYGAVICGVLAAPVLADGHPWLGLGAACLRAAATALFFAGLRVAYLKLRGCEGLGLGDVKLAAAVGAWLPFEAIPYCFCLASVAALVSVIVRGRGMAVEDIKLPFGTFLCPALWLMSFVNLLRN